MVTANVSLVDEDNSTWSIFYGQSAFPLSGTGNKTSSHASGLPGDTAADEEPNQKSDRFAFGRPIRVEHLGDLDKVPLSYTVDDFNQVFYNRMGDTKVTVGSMVNIVFIYSASITPDQKTTVGNTLNFPFGK